MDTYTFKISDFSSNIVCNTTKKKYFIDKVGISIGCVYSESQKKVCFSFQFKRVVGSERDT